jgi:hypothetical protein
MSYSNSLDHAKWAKLGLLAGVALLALGASGEIIGHMLFEDLPGWEETLFVYAEGLGILVGFFSPLIFGIVMPLTGS